MPLQTDFQQDIKTKIAAAKRALEECAITVDHIEKGFVVDPENVYRVRFIAIQDLTVQKNKRLESHKTDVALVRVLYLARQVTVPEVINDSLKAFLPVWTSTLKGLIAVLYDSNFMIDDESIESFISAGRGNVTVDEILNELRLVEKGRSEDALVQQIKSKERDFIDALKRAQNFLDQAWDLLKKVKVPQLAR